MTAKCFDQKRTKRIKFNVLIFSLNMFFSYSLACNLQRMTAKTDTFSLPQSENFLYKQISLNT